jgi:hypothetical protein
MADKGDGDERWLEGRTRHVRVYLTEEEHALVRQAAAAVDRSVSRFSIEAIMAAARTMNASPPAPPADSPAATPPAAAAKRGRPASPAGPRKPAAGDGKGGKRKGGGE